MEHTLVNIVGVIASFREVTRAAHGRRDYTSSVTLCDPTRSLVGTGLLCFFYHPRPDEVPQPLRTGEILIAYDMRIKPHGHDIQAWSTHTTKFKLVAPGFDLRTLRPDEAGSVTEMHEWWNARGGTPGAKGDIVKRDKEGKVVNEEGPVKSKKMTHIGAMEPYHFYDVVCEVPLSLRFTDEGGQDLLWTSVCVVRHRLYTEYFVILVCLVSTSDAMEGSLWQVHPSTFLLGYRRGVCEGL